MGLPREFSRIRFRESARAELNVGRLARSLPEALQKLLPIILGQLPDPDTSLNNLERFSPHLEGGLGGALERRPVLLHYLLACFSYSRTLSETLLTQPDLLLWLARDKGLDRMKTAEDLQESFARFEAVAGEKDPAVVLVRFKRREYLRIALRDIIRLASLTETTLELSLLADTLAGQALATASRTLEREFGWPHTVDERGRPVRSRFSVVALGKLGGNELNYHSDIDLLFLYDGEGRCAGGESGQELAASEFFLRLGQELMTLLTGHTPEGAVYRVDVRLRPGGGEGDLVVSLPAAVEYYRGRAREWERQMLLKARHSAGDDSLFREFERGIEPLQFESDHREAVVTAVFEARRQMDAKLARSRRDGVNVKLSPGGIRDIEFLVQCLQRLHGGPDRWVRSRGTLLGLQRLADKGYLSSRDHHVLAAAYEFLRVVEHRLQLDRGLQTHTVPGGRDAFAVLARRCRVETFGAEVEGDEITAQFQRVLEQHTRQVRAICDRVLQGGAGEQGFPEFRLRAEETETAAHALEHAPLLRRLRQRSEAVYRAAVEAGVPVHAKRPFERFLAAAMDSPFAFEALAETPDALNGVAAVVGWSRPVGELLIRHPEGVGWIAGSGAEDPDQARLGFDSGTAGEGWAERFDPGTGLVGGLPREEFLALVRRGHAQDVLRWGLGALLSSQGTEAALREYTRLADKVMTSVWGASGGSLGGPEVAVLSLGRLSGDELDLGSDIDLVFVAADEEVQRECLPVVERFVGSLSAHVREGALFQVDARLRPDGRSGELVQTSAGMLEYFRSRARMWELAAYLKCVALHAGHSGFGRRWRSELMASMEERTGDLDEVRKDLDEMRKRLEEEAAAAPGGADFSKGAGGVYDIEYILALESFRTGSVGEGRRSMTGRLEELREAGAVSEHDAGILLESANLYRTVDHAIRLVTGKSASSVPTGRTGELVAELAGRRVGEPMSASTLATELAEHQQRVRVVYERIFER